MENNRNESQVERFMASKEGQRRLKATSDQLIKKKIVKVTYSNEGGCVGATLHLSGGGSFLVYPPSLIVHALPDAVVGEG